MKSTQSTSWLNHWVHYSLLAGVSLSGLILAIGLILTLVTGKHAAANAAPAWRLIVQRSLGGDPSAVLGIGLLVLMATPVVRVVVLGFGWLAEGETRFAAVAFAVFVLLAVSALFGAAG